MKGNILILVWLGLFLVLPNFALADCGNIGGFTSFSVTGNNTVTVYTGTTPFVKFDVMDCSVDSKSKIQLIKSYVCDGDEILIDGSKCTIMSVSTDVR